jgi:RNA ligase (TIGR02306 family)
MSEDIRQLVKVVTIDSLEPIPGADLIEAAKVGGWTVVVQKGLYEPGDSAVYFEIDSCLPLSDPRFEHLRARGVKEHEGKEFHRLKTVKLRGVVSQGMLMPLKEFEIEWLGNLLGHGTYEEQLGIFKYDDIDPVSTRSGTAIAGFPTHVVRKTDSERIQNLAGAWQEIREFDDWFATEKIDGCSLTVVRENGELKVCSRNWQVPSNEGVFGTAFQRHRDLFEQLGEGDAVQAEIAGPGIQGNRLGLAEQRIFVFNFTQFGHVLERRKWPTDFRYLEAPQYHGLTLGETVDETIAKIDGIKSLVSKDRLAEGVVWVNYSHTPMTVLGDRHQFKTISNKYLLKEK